MNREEILKRSRAEGHDEGEAHAANRGRYYGKVAICALYAVILLRDLAYAADNPAPHILFWGYFSAECFGKYRFTRGLSWLLLALYFGAIAARELIAFL